MNIETLLNEEIKSEFDCLRELEAGSSEFIATVEGVAKLMDRAIEIEKIKIEQDEYEYRRRVEIQTAQQDQKDRTIKNCLTAAGIVLPLGVTIWGTLKSLRFETDGVVTTIVGKGFINKLLPKK